MNKQSWWKIKENATLFISSFPYSASLHIWESCRRPNHGW